MNIANKQYNIKNARFKIVKSDKKGFNKIQVSFSYDGKEHEYFIFIKNHKNADYISEAKKQFMKELESRKIVETTTKRPKHPFIGTISILSIMLLVFASLFFYTALHSKGGDVPTEDPGVVSHEEFDSALSFTDIKYLQVNTLTDTYMGKTSINMEISPTIYHEVKTVTRTLQPMYEESFVTKNIDGTYDKYSRNNTEKPYVLTRNVDASEFITSQSEEVNISKQLKMFNLSYDSFAYDKNDSSYVTSFTPKSFSHPIDDALKFENKKIISAKQNTDGAAGISDVTTYKYEPITPELPYVPPAPPTYELISVNDSIIINPTIFVTGVPYEGTITIKKGVTKVLPEELDIIKLAHSSTSLKDVCTYKKLSGREATLEIPAEAITDDIIFDLTLVDPQTTYHVYVSPPNDTEIEPNTFEQGDVFVGTIKVITEGKLLPNQLSSASLEASGESIVEDCEYIVASDKKSAILTIPSKHTIRAQNILVAVELEDANKRWYEYEDWWNYCSNGDSIIQATEDDIGKEVEVEVNSLKHKVRLIGINHDDLTDGTGKAHCTFDFANLITHIDEKEFKTEPTTVPWDINVRAPFTSNNHNYVKSFVNTYLNSKDTADSIINLLPDGLEENIKYVNKRVGIGDSYSTENPFSEKLFLLSHDEMIAHTKGVANGEGNIYEYYKKDKAIFKKKPVNYDYEWEYWLRSPATEDLKCAWFWDYSESKFTYAAVVAGITVAPAFCI
ncbi:MAG: DUF6273 domain-containing protein [Bacilli bacterium]|nr:DUF6273 domain-containing protein [Bacilli bacterium]